MQMPPNARTAWHPADAVPPALPIAPDSETLALLRAFLGPILEQAVSWTDLRDSLAAKGYGLAFRSGRLVILNTGGTPVCTGQMLGTPLRLLSSRLGRPVLTLEPGGTSATLSR